MRRRSDGSGLSTRPFAKLPAPSADKSSDGAVPSLKRPTRIVDGASGVRSIPSLNRCAARTAIVSLRVELMASSIIGTYLPNLDAPQVRGLSDVLCEVGVTDSALGPRKATRAIAEDEVC
jgi:hypothetical protein